MKRHFVEWADKAMNRWLSRVVDLADPPQRSSGQTERPVRECPAIAAVAQDSSPSTPLRARGESYKGDGLIVAGCGKGTRGSENDG
jgi:hypothetical protein